MVERSKEIPESGNRERNGKEDRGNFLPLGNLNFQRENYCDARRKMIFVWIRLKMDVMMGLIQEVASLAGNAGSQTSDCFLCVLKELCACACVCVCMCVF